MQENGAKPDRQPAGHKAVFLDKDGTLVEDVPYNVDPAYIRLMPHTLPALKRLHDAGFRLIIITNQSGVARGYFAERDLQAVEAYLRQVMAEHDIPLSGFYYCPHHPEGEVSPYATTCGCRKPAPGLFQIAARQHHIDCSRSWYVGDILNDVEAGRRAGCRTILLDSGGETEWELNRQRLPHHIVDDLAQAAAIITALPEPDPDTVTRLAAEASCAN